MSERTGLLRLVAAAGILGMAVLVAAAILLVERGGGRDEPESELAGFTPEVAATYRFVSANRDLAAHIPCYCGCGPALGHESLLTCFIRPGGGWDDHAAGCGVCLGEARHAQRLQAAGQGAAEIRAWIDAEYAGVGTPTDTR